MSQSSQSSQRSHGSQIMMVDKELGQEPIQEPTQESTQESIQEPTQEQTQEMISDMRDDGNDDDDDDDGNDGDNGDSNLSDNISNNQPDDSDQYVNLKGNVQVIEVENHEGRKGMDDSGKGFILGRSGVMYKGLDARYVKLYSGQSVNFSFTHMQKCTFIQLKQAGWGDANACMEIGSTLTTLEHTYREDPYFHDLIKTHNYAFEDRCEELIFQHAMSGSISSAKDYLSICRNNRNSRINNRINQQKVRLQKQETKAKISALEHINGNVNIDETINLSVLNNTELDRYSFLYNKITSSAPLTTDESVEYVTLQQRVMTTKKLEVNARGKPVASELMYSSTVDQNTDDDSWE